MADLSIRAPVYTPPSLHRMIDAEQFARLVDRIARLNGLSVDLAAEYAAQIGDTPDLAEDGRAVIYNDAGQEIAMVRFEC